MVKTGCGNDQVGLRKGMSGLATILNEKSPLEHDILGKGKNALIEHRPYLVGQPVIEFGTPDGIADHLDAISNFSESHRADEQRLEWLGRNERHNPRFWAWPTQFRDDVGVEKPAVHSLTLRTGMTERRGSILMSRCGEA